MSIKKEKLFISICLCTRLKPTEVIRDLSVLMDWQQDQVKSKEIDILLLLIFIKNLLHMLMVVDSDQHYTFVEVKVH